MSLARNSTNLTKVKNIVSSGYNIQVYSSYGDVLENQHTYDNNIEKKLKLLPHNNFIFKIINYFYFSFLIFYHTSKEKPNILLLHDSNHLFVAFLLKKIYSIKIGIDFHEIIWDAGYPLILNKIFLFNEKIFCKYLDFAIFPTKERKDIIINKISFQCNFCIYPNFSNNLQISKINNLQIKYNTAIYFGVINNITFDELVISIKLFLKIGFKIDLYCFGSHVEQFRLKFQNLNDIRILNQVSHKELLHILPKYAISICVYKSNCLNNIYCAPRKFYDSIYNLVPVYVNDKIFPSSNKILDNYIIRRQSISQLDIVNCKNKLITNFEGVHNNLIDISYKANKDLHLLLSQITA
jgi:hypothetical protein